MVKLSYINLKECYFKVLYTKVISLMQDKFVHYRNCYGDCKIGEILAMDQTDCFFEINNIKLTIVVQCNSVKFCLRSSVTWVKIKEALRSFAY